MIDFPQECAEFVEFYGTKDRKGSGYATLPTIQVVGQHDKGRRMKYAARIQLEFLRKRGKEYVTAWYLHQALDYVENAPILPIEEILKRLENKTEPCKELEVVKDFVMKHFREILRDCRRDEK